MPSSISSSDLPHDPYARETASDRPGVAQPVPLRPVPAQPWGLILLAAVVVFALLLGGWEWHWRAFGMTPGFRNGYALWAIQRRRIDAGEGNATVLLGASRMYFDLQLPEWERLAGRRPIQLSFEGTSPLPYLQDLAADPKFTGRVLVGIAPEVFFTGGGYRAGALNYIRKESPSQRIGQWLSMRLIEPYLAFEDPDFALQTVLARQPWPERPGKHWITQVRELSQHEADRNTYLWSKVETDRAYRELARRIWLEEFEPSPDDPSPAEVLNTAQEQIVRAAAAVAKLRERGVKVLFVRLPSSGPFLAYENRTYPRAQHWDALLAATGAPGIYFEDYPQLQGFYLPEWSHMSRAEAQRFTPILYNLIEHEFSDWCSCDRQQAPP